MGLLLGTFSKTAGEEEEEEDRSVCDDGCVAGHPFHAITESEPPFTLTEWTPFLARMKLIPKDRRDPRYGKILRT
jgi:hypothetical protein